MKMKLKDFFVNRRINGARTQSSRLEGADWSRQMPEMKLKKS